MRGALRDKQSRYGHYRSGERRNSAQSTREGYSMRPSSGRGDGPRTAVEVRLGKLQVGVWIGLASAAIVASYAIGFFSGRHVGFEVARDTSVTDLAKLSAPRAPDMMVTKNSAQIYEKLNAPAILEESVIEAGSTENFRGPPTKSKAVETDISEDDDIFRDITSGGELIIGDAPSMKRVLDKHADTKRFGGRASVDKILDTGRARLETQSNSAKKVGDESRGLAQATSRDSNFVEIVPKGFYVQVAAPKRLQDAEKLAMRLQKSGFPVAVEAASVGKQKFYRVLVGPERSNLYADRLLGQLHTEKYIPTDPFIREVR